MPTNSSSPSGFLYRGLDLIGTSIVSYEGPNLGIMLSAAADANANFVSLSSVSTIDEHTGLISDFNDNRSTNGPFDDATVRFADLGPAIAAAQSSGFTVMLKPIALGPNSQPWLGNPSTKIDDPATFFASYQTYILKFATLAEQYHVPVLEIGSEMWAATLPVYTPYWDSLITAVRQVYSGKLTYAALPEDATQLQFWDKLDFATLDFNALLVRTSKSETPPADPSISTLNAGWHVIAGFAPGYDNISQMQYIEAIAAKTGKDILMQLGFPAVSTAANGQGDVLRTDPAVPADYAAQANLWESFFETYGGQSKPSWLLGQNVQLYDPAILSAKTGDGQYDFWSKEDTIYGKPANVVVASWYGGSDYLSPSQSSIAGAISNDFICLYGNDISKAIQTVGNKPIVQAATFKSTISITLMGNIINGQTQILHVYANGSDLGAQTLVTMPAGNYAVDSYGIPYSLQTYNFYADGLANINDLKIAFDGPVNVGGPGAAQTNLMALSVNEVPLTQLTYHPLGGSTQQQTVGVNSGQAGGGYLVADATPWNVALPQRTIGTSANPIQVTGGGGTDTVNVLGTPSQIEVSGVGTDTLNLSENSGLNQNAVLKGISYLAFLDGALLDLSTGIWSVSANAATISASLDDYQALAASGKLSGIAILDANAPTLAITATQSASDAQALGKISNSYNFLITVGSGNQTINGGNGIDTAIFTGNRSSFAITHNSDGTYSVVDNTGPLGSDVFKNVEELKFTDMTVNLTIQAKAAAALQADVDHLTELYVAFFNRVPDANGLAYWIDQMSAGQSLNQIAESFYSAGVTYAGLTGFSAGMSDQAFINVFYKNVLGRPDGADAGGLAYWSGKLADGSSTRSSLGLDIVYAAHNFKGDPTWGWVADLLDNKIAVAKTFAIDRGLNYNTADDNITHGMAIAAAVTSTSTDAAIALIGVTGSAIHLG